MAAATMYVTPAGAGAKNGTNWANAFGKAEAITDWSTNAEAGDIYFIAGGTYTLTASGGSGKAGTAALPIQFIGVKAGTIAEPCSISDYAYGVDRPLFVCSTNSFNFSGGYLIFRNLQVTIQYSLGFYLGGSPVYVINCYAYNSAVLANYPAFYLGGAASLVTCEAISTNGYGIRVAGYTTLLNNYVHDSAYGLYLVGSNSNFIGNVIDTCSIGIYLQANNNNFYCENVIYNCTTGVSSSTGYTNTFISNIISNCVTGANWSSAIVFNVFDYNCWNNTTDVVNVTKGSNDITADPLFLDAPNGDFRLKSASPCINSGMPSLFSGFSSIGAWQRKSFLRVK